MNVEVKVQSLGLDRSSNTPVVILREMGGERVLPIWIGPGEASAIAMHLADMKFSRPLTHDLLVAMLRGLGGRLDRAVITRVTDATFFAELVVQVGEREVVVDARPSDSIAVALRAGARLFANEALLERASIELSEDDAVPGVDSGGESEGGGGFPGGEPDVESSLPWDWPDPASSPGAGGAGSSGSPGSGSGGGPGQGKGAGSGAGPGAGPGAGKGKGGSSAPGGSGGGAAGGPGSPGKGGGSASPSGPRPMGPEELKEYLRKLNPEDFGRFSP